MNKEITILELFNSYAKSIKQPRKIKYKNKIYVYDGNAVLGQLINEYQGNIIALLNEKVEILEEDKPIIEKISRLNYQQIGTYQLDNNDTLGFIKALNEQLTKHGRKLNEIIDYINKKEVDKR